MTHLPAWLRLLRPQQWTKNLAALAGVIFGGRMMQPWAIGLDLLVVLVFIAASAATYVLNDRLDVEYDRRHPQKRNRPLATGEVSLGAATWLAAGLSATALLAAALLNRATLACVVLYLVLNVLYSLRFKHVPLLDVTSIALGYVLRVLASIYVLGDVPTAWIALCTFFLALFFGISKRRAEFLTEGAQTNRQRPVLLEYDLPLLDSLLSSSATMTLMSYALFTTTSGKGPTLIVTVPIVYYAVMHYRSLATRGNGGEEPDQVLLHDRTIQLCVALWLAAFVVIFYGHLELFR
jgi:4-hydroxybenzoate polyprenyltransferase